MLRLLELRTLGFLDCVDPSKSVANYYTGPGCGHPKTSVHGNKAGMVQSGHTLNMLSYLFLMSEVFKEWFPLFLEVGDPRSHSNKTTARTTTRKQENGQSPDECSR